ncbi:hypothetical protein [Novosphingobium aquae]|jgi:hypothetical protein|uniref:Uncharacterized protein n=1 Tax=Novosphingobium aquae TaxID=3133435 RepID=A0ABU8S6L4_9SPHN
MDPQELIPYLGWLIGGGLILGIGGILASMHNTRLKIKHGYPLTGGWGQAIHPKSTTEDGERIKLLTQENATLRAELGSVKDRLATIERIVTDGGYSLTHQIEALRDQPKN